MSEEQKFMCQADGSALGDPVSASPLQSDNCAEAVMHDLKCWPMFFEQLKSGEKTFEIRKDDRGYKVHDILMIREFDGTLNEYTASAPLWFRVTSVMKGIMGLQANYACLSLMAIWPPLRSQIKEQSASK